MKLSDEELRKLAHDGLISISSRSAVASLRVMSMAQELLERRKQDAVNKAARKVVKAYRNLQGWGLEGYEVGWRKETKERYQRDCNAAAYALIDYDKATEGE